MGSRAEPAVLATVLAAVAGFLLFMPYIARQYRRRGELRAGNLALDFAWLLYCFGLISYVLFPLAFAGVFRGVEVAAGAGLAVLALLVVDEDLDRADVASEVPGVVVSPGQVFGVILA